MDELARWAVSEKFIIETEDGIKTYFLKPVIRHAQELESWRRKRNLSRGDVSQILAYSKLRVQLDIERDRLLDEELVPTCISTETKNDT